MSMIHVGVQLLSSLWLETKRTYTVYQLRKSINPLFDRIMVGLSFLLNPVILN